MFASILQNKFKQPILNLITCKQSKSDERSTVIGDKEMLCDPNKIILTHRFLVHHLAILRSESKENYPSLEKFINEDKKAQDTLQFTDNFLTRKINAIFEGRVSESGTSNDNIVHDQLRSAAIFDEREIQLMSDLDIYQDLSLIHI